MQDERENGNNIAVALYFLFKSAPIAVSGLCIYLGYKLFVLGVSGQASIVVNAKDLGGQLLNAAPGLFFGVGGIVALVAIIIKGVDLRLGGNNLHSPSEFLDEVL